MGLFSFLYQLQTRWLDNPALTAVITLLSLFDLIFGFIEFLDEYGGIKQFCVVVVLTATIIGFCAFMEPMFAMLIVVIGVFLIILLHARTRAKKREFLVTASIGDQCAGCSKSLDLTLSTEYKRANSCIADERPREAINYLLKCKGTITGEARFFISYADALILLGNFAGALAKLDAIPVRQMKQRQRFVDIMRRKACCYHGLHKYKEELACCDDLLTKGISPEKFYLYRAKVKLRMLEVCLDLKSADQAIRTISSSRPDFIESILSDLNKALNCNKHKGDQYTGIIFSHMGAAYLYAQLYQKAWEYLSIAQNKNEFYPNTYIYLGIYHYFHGNLNQAVDKLKKAVSYDQDVNTSFDIAFLYLAKVYYDMENYDEALHCAAQSLAIFPYCSECFSIQGNCYSIGKSMLVEAIEYYTKAIKLHPRAEDYRQRARCVYSGKEDVDQACCDMQEAIKLNDCDTYRVALLVYQSDVDKKRGIIKDKENLDKILAPYTDNPNCYCDLGIIYFNYEYLDDSQCFYRKAIGENPRDSIAHYNLSIILEQLKLYDEAIDELNTAITLNPMDIKPHRLVITCYKCVNDVYNEIQAQKRLDELNYYYCEVQKRNGDAVYHIGKYREAIGYYEAALAYCSTPAVLNNLACAYYAQERYKDAIDCLEKVIKLDKTYYLAYLNLGNSQLRLSEAGTAQDLEKAKENFQTAIELNAECNQAALMLEFFCAENIEMVIDTREIDAIM